MERWWEATGKVAASSDKDEMAQQKTQRWENEEENLQNSWRIKQMEKEKENEKEKVNCNGEK